MMKKSNKKGFTLVELIVVIAIMAILAAVLVPTVTSKIKDANESKAKSNCSSIANAIQSAVVSANSGLKGDNDYCTFTLTGAGTDDVAFDTVNQKTLEDTKVTIAKDATSNNIKVSYTGYDWYYEITPKGEVKASGITEA